MAFGTGFNKAKVMSAAEKFVAQGKIPAAIEEYLKVLQHDQKDLTLLNTIADLLVRAGKNDEAVKRFCELAEKCVEAGLVPRAIATYKRVSKIAPESVEAMMRLGDLYSMQGLLRDARGNYLQAVDYYSSHREKEKARDVFEKLLMLDMENPELQVRMAGLYADTGKKEEAVATYLSAVERYLERGQADEASAALQTLLRLDPKNPDAGVLLSRTQMEQGELEKAVGTLQAIPSIAMHKGALSLLFEAYSKLGDAAKAAETAQQLFEAHGDFFALAQISEGFRSRGELNEALEIYESASQRLIAEREFSPLMQGPQNILASEPSHIGALQLMLRIHQASGKVGEIRETMELLAHAYKAQGELEKARELYAELSEMEPDNTDHIQLLRRVEAEMGHPGGAVDESAEPASAMAAELSDVAQEEPHQAETLAPLEAQMVRDCITEAELYIAYKQTSKAIATLETGLSQLPGNITLTEQLLSLCEQSHQYRRAAECCQVLAEAYVKLGDGERAARFGELLLTYQQKSPESELQSPEDDLSASQFLVDEGSPAGESSFAGSSASAEPEAEDQAEVHEVDLSTDWASAASAEESSVPGSADDSDVEEIEFYIQAGLVSDAAEALERLQKRTPLHAAIPAFQQRLGISAAEPAPVPEIPAASPESEPLAAAFALDPEPPVVSSAPPLEEQGFSLDETLLNMEASPPPPAFELSLDEAVTAPQQQAAPATPVDPFADLAGDLEEALTLPGVPQDEPRSSPLQPPTVSAPHPVSPASPAAQAGANSLDDLFAEFKEGVEGPAVGEDFETHYNMGVAFKEMALYDEAIGEFQKVQQLATRLNDHSHLVQCCSLLATCFLEKGLPQLAVKWYQTALDTPGVDTESVPALLYEMGCAYEIAGDRQAALRSFLEVYARNIDYRDVASRIQSLQQAQ